MNRDCFDKDTEVLTNHGWKLFKDVDIKNDLFFSRQPGTQILAYKKAKKFIHTHYEGQMFHYTTANYDLMTTPNHKLFMAKDYFDTLNKVYQKEGFIPAEKIPNARFQSYSFITYGGKYSGTTEKEINICGKKFDKKKFARFLGLFLMNGKILEDNTILVENENKRKNGIFEEIIKESGLEYQTILPTEDNKEAKKWTISSKYFSWFKPFKESFRVPIDFKESDFEVLEILLEGMSAVFSQERKITLACTSLELCNDAIEIAFKIGKHATYKELKTENVTYYTIVVGKNERSYYYNKYLTFEDYNDEVYGVSLEEWHTLLVRRNGKPVWCGN